MIYIMGMLLLIVWVLVPIVYGIIVKMERDAKSNSVHDYFQMEEASDKVESLLNELGIKTMEDVEND